LPWLAVGQCPCLRWSSSRSRIRAQITGRRRHLIIPTWAFYELSATIPCPMANAGHLPCLCFALPYTCSSSCNSPRFATG
jgi:hypothetical protein